MIKSFGNIAIEGKPEKIICSFMVGSLLIKINCFCLTTYGIYCLLYY